MKKKRIIIAVAIIIITILLSVAVAALIPMLPQVGQAEPAQNNTEENTTDEYSIDWDYWLSINPDIVAWVQVPDTNIDYPIVAAPSDNPEFYLSHNVYKEYDYAGAPYLDAKCEKDLTSFNSVVSGHSLSNGQLFSDFQYFSDYQYFNDHQQINLYTPNRTYKLNVVAANVVNGWSEEKRIEFASQREYWKYWGEQLGVSEVLSEDVPQKPQQDFCFVTCSYQTNNSRTLVYATIDSYKQTD